MRIQESEEASGETPDAARETRALPKTTPLTQRYVKEQCWPRFHAVCHQLSTINPQLLQLKLDSELFTCLRQGFGRQAHFGEAKGCLAKGTRPRREESEGGCGQ